MLRLIARLYFWSIGFKLKGRLPDGVQKAVCIAAPHTDNQDFIIGWMGFAMRGYPTHFLIKKEAFKGIKKVFLAWAGAIPVDRANSTNMVKQVTERMRTARKMYLIITPEGTRKQAQRWKTGFYYIAKQAGVPIVLTYIDYGRKEGGYGPVLYPTDNVEADFAFIRQFYSGITPKHPDQYTVRLEVPRGTEAEAQA